MALGTGRGGTTMGVTVVGAVAIAFAVTALLRPSVPPRPENLKLAHQGKFLGDGAEQAVFWELPRPEAALMAREQGKLLFVLLSRSSSPGGALADRLAFSDPEMAEQINRQFVPVRIDLDREVGWEGAILPFRRLSEGSESDFEMMIVHPVNGLLAWTSRSSSTDRLDFTGLAGFLRSYKRSDRAKQEIHAGLDREWKMSRVPGGSASPETWARVTAEASGNQGGLHSFRHRLELQPFAWHALLSCGLVTEVEQEFRATLSTPMMEANSALFFDSAESRDGREVNGLFPAIKNASAMVLASRLARTGKSEWRALATRMGRAVYASFVRGDSIASWLQDPSGSDGSQPLVLSIKQGQIWGTLTARERSLAWKTLGLDPTSSPKMTPFPAELDLWLEQPGELSRLEAKLSSLQSFSSLERTGQDSLVTISHLAACFLEAGSLVGDEEMIEMGRQLFRRASLHGKGNGEVELITTRPAPVSESISSPLAFAEACLQMWNVTGDEEALKKGRACLERAAIEYTTGGSLRSMSSQTIPLAPDVKWPLNWLDASKPSDAGLATRLFNAYGAIFKDRTLTNLGEDLRITLRPLLAVEHPLAGSLAEAIALSERQRLAATPKEFASLSKDPTILPLRALPTPAKKPASAPPFPSEPGHLSQHPS